MLPKYNIGDRVTVVHRMAGTYYYSYSLAGSTGTIDQMKQLGDDYLYHIDYDDIVIVHPELVSDQKAVEAWYRECCLDPAPKLNAVGLEDFEAVLN